jgi:hypothetical protein
MFFGVIGNGRFGDECCVTGSFIEADVCRWADERLPLHRAFRRKQKSE